MFAFTYQIHAKHGQKYPAGHNPGADVPGGQYRPGPSHRVGDVEPAGQ